MSNKESFSTYNVTLDYFETVITNPTTFLNDVSDGQVTLKLLGQKFDLDLHEVKIVSDDAKIIAEMDRFQMLLKPILIKE